MAKLTRDAAEIFHDYDLHIPSRTIFLGGSQSDEDTDGTVSYKMAEKAIKNLHLLDTSGEGQITIIVNSGGGDFSMGQAIYNCIKSCKSRVLIKAVGECMSAASFILQAADERLMYQDCTMMIHYGESTIKGDVKSASRWAAWNKNGSRWMEEIYLERIKEVKPDFAKSKLKKMLAHDYIISADEALSLGLIDGIIGPEGSITTREEE